MISAADILRGKILIVDDQEANIALLEQILKGAGYTSISSTMEPERVCELHLLNRYDLILLDLQMPGMDGFQVMENLKEIETAGYLPVLVITAQPAHKLRALKAGARDFVSKPFDLSEVILRVRNMLEVRLLHLETKRLYERVLAEQKIAERLLQNVLPPAVVDGLKELPTVTSDSPVELITESYAEVTALFADLAEFARFSKGASAEVLLGVLQDLTRRAANPDSLEKTPAMDEAYLAAAGLPDALANHSVIASQRAVDLAEAIHRFNANSRYTIKVRIGFDTDTTSPKETPGQLSYEL